MAAALAIGSNAASARHYRHHLHHHHRRHVARVHHAYSPPTASIVVDGNTDKVLEASHADASRHPASLTKVMTLYLLFERLRAGKISLNTPLKVSAHAAAQSPTKLGLKPGQTIRVEDAIKAIVTRSANDAAVVIAENLGGSERAFARLMTRKARELGMTRTTYVNASGLPDDRQVTTARDQATLARVIEARFPHLFHFFATRSFVFRGEVIRGHDHLLGSVPGVDGMKTGFTDASGFNLMTTLHRDHRYLIGIVFGGRTAARRDAHMRRLLEATFRRASAHRAAPVVAARKVPKRERKKVARATAPAAQPVGRSHAAARQAKASRQRLVVGSTAPIQAIPVKTIDYRTVTVHAGKLASMPVLVPVRSRSRTATDKAKDKALVAAVEPAKPTAVKSTRAGSSPTPHPHSGWMIQIGAFNGVKEAQQHLKAAKRRLRHTLRAADSFTEPVHKGDTTLYRARFAGLDKETAKAACRKLRRDDFACMTLKD